MGGRRRLFDRVRSARPRAGELADPASGRAILRRPGRNVRLALAAGSLFWTSLSAAQAQTPPPGCDPDLLRRSAALSHGYAVRTGYCDGAVANPNFGGIALVSATVGPLAAPSGRLTIRRHDAISGPLRLRGVDMRQGRSYRLDALVPRDGLQVDLSVAAAPNNVTLADLGLLAWRERANAPPLYVPVSGASAAGPVTVRLRLARGALRLGWQLCDSLGCGPQVVRPQNVPAGGLVEVPIPRAAAAAETQLRVSALQPGGEVATLVVDLLAPARP